MLFNHHLRSARRLRRFENADPFLAKMCAVELIDRLSSLGVSSEALYLLQTENLTQAGELHPSLAQSHSIDMSWLGELGEMLIADPKSLPALAVIMTLHWVNDLPGFLLQCRQALQPNGLFAAAFLGGRSLHELRTVLNLAESNLTGGATPRVSPFLDIRDAGMLLARAGFAEPVADIMTFDCTYPTPLALMHDLRSMNENNALLASASRPLRKSVLFEASRLYRELYPAKNDRVRATFEIIFMTGWAPSG